MNNANDLKKEIEKPTDAELDFECSNCEQWFYEHEDVDSEPLFFGEPPSPKPVSSKGFQKKQANRIGFNTATDDFTTEPSQVLGHPVDELAAIVKSLESHERFSIETKRSVLEVVDEMVVVDGQEVKRKPEEFGAERNDDKVSAMVVAEPKENNRTPDAVICEYCKNSIEGNNE